MSLDSKKQYDQIVDEILKLSEVLMENYIELEERPFGIFSSKIKVVLSKVDCFEDLGIIYDEGKYDRGF